MTHRLLLTFVFQTVFLPALTAVPASAQLATAFATPPDDVNARAENVLSEGVRLTAEVFAPKNPASEKLPTIVMCHGWGGLAEYLRPDAVVFAKAGYLVVTFDYRGWGASDGRLVLADKQHVEQKDGKRIAEVKEIRGVVDPVDQTTDLMNVINWTVGDKQCDPERLGLWGSSYGGGHVLYVAARDARVKALVSQVGGMDSRFVTASPQLRDLTHRQGTARARGQLGYPQPGEKFGSLTGMPILEKLVGYAPVEEVGKIQNCAMLFLLAENDELVDNKDHGLLAFSRATGTKKLVVIPGIKHYGVYNEARGRAQQEAVTWFDQNLKK